MSEENIRELQELLEFLGFSGKTAWDLESYKETDAPCFHLFYGLRIGEDTLLYTLTFQKEKDGNYRLDGYHLSLTSVEVPGVTIRDIDTRVLEAALKRVDAYFDLFLGGGWIDSLTKEEYNRIAGYIEATNASLERLASFKEGKEVAKLLLFKYWPECRYRQHFADYRAMEIRYRVVHYFPFTQGNKMTADQSYQLLKARVMNEKNYEYLKDNVKYLGFGEGLAEALKEQMQSGVPAFHLSFDTEIARKAFSAVLSFRKSENADMYFFNSYHATLTRSNGEVKDQAFYLNKGKGVTAKEAYNLLEGRAVYKELENREGEKYHAWLQIDFTRRDKNNNHELKQYHDAYGYDLNDALGKFPIRDMKEPDLRDILLSSLQKGNLQAVAFEKEGSAVRMFVEAAPQYKSINVYDSELKRVPNETLQKYQVEGKEKVGGKEVERSIGKEKKVDQSTLGENAQTPSSTKKVKDRQELLPQKDGPTNGKGAKLN